MNFKELLNQFRDPQKLEELKAKLNNNPTAQARRNKGIELLERVKAKIEEQNNAK